MTHRNLLIWDPDLNQRTAGYSVSDGVTTTVVKSNAFFDPTAFADEAAARLATYTISATYDATEGPAEDDVLGEPTAPTLIVSRFSFDTDDVDFCLLTGRISAAGGMSAMTEVRVSVYWQDTPHLVSGFGYLSADETVFWTNCRGEFSIPVVRQARLLLHIPSAHLHGLIIVPDTTTINFKDVSFEPIDIRRNR